MSLNLQQKKDVVAEVNAVAAKALSVVGAENRGLTVAQITDLRVKARAQGVYLRVVKNTLARKAVAGTAFECISPALKGPLLLAFSKDDPGAAARVVKDFLKSSNEKLVRQTGFPRWAAPASRGHRESRKPPNPRAGARHVDGHDEGADPEAGRHLAGDAIETGADAGRGQGPERSFVGLNGFLSLWFSKFVLPENIIGCQ